MKPLCPHNWHEVDWLALPTYLIPESWRRNPPVIRVCRMCWETEGRMEELRDYIASSYHLDID